jgi:two-component system response regulator NreC
MHPKIRVLLADDHAILRSGLRLLIDGQSDMQVVGESGEFDETIRLTRSLVPDVVSLDLTMPGGTGLSAIERLRASRPSVRIVVLTMHDDPAYVRSALAAGASGYVAKSAADAALIGAIRAVHRGRLFIDVGNQHGTESLLTPGGVDREAATPLSTLSAREREVLLRVAQGHTNQAIADQLRLSVKTVESYRSRLMQKLGLVNRAELTRLALELGLLSAPPMDDPET